MNKPLTPSQQYHLIILNERVRNAEQVAQLAVKAAKTEVSSFVEYLADEHGAPPADGWTLKDILVGFERPALEGENT